MDEPLSIWPNDGLRGWLMAGDPAIRWQVLRDLDGAPAHVWAPERDRVAEEGWGRRLLEARDPEGTWGHGLYSPKWTSTTYTLLLLRRLGLPPGHPAALQGCRLLIERGLAADGGIDLSATLYRSETCVSGMMLALVVAHGFRSPATEALVSYLLREQMPDGGWNCQRFAGATHSSFHTSINVLEGLRAYVEEGGERKTEVERAEARGREFFLAHHLYRSHRTGQVVKGAFTRFSFPPRWHHDVLRTLEVFSGALAPYDERLEDPVGLVVRKRSADGTWALQNRHSGRVFFELEAVGEASRWNTLRALRVLRWWETVRGR